MNKMKAWQGSYGVSRHDGIVSPAYFVLEVMRFGSRSIFIQQLVPEHTSPFFTQASDGVRIGHVDLSLVRLREIPFAVPPAAEQSCDRIRFLEHVDRRISHYIRAKGKLIALLEEQKQAIIHRTVTGQIDVRTGQPYSNYKDSGVEWLGRVPRHWDVRSFSRTAVEKADYRGATPNKRKSGVFLITAKNIRDGWIDYDSQGNSSQKMICPRNSHASAVFLKSGDLLLTTEAPLGNAALVDRELSVLSLRG